jgi:hypothetical protein
MVNEVVPANTTVPPSRKAETSAASSINIKQIQSAVTELMNALEEKAKREAQVQHRTKIMNLLTLEACTIKIFREKLAKPRKVITTDQIMDFAFHQLNLASTLYAAYYNYFKPGNAESISYNINSTLQQIFKVVTHEVISPNGTVQTHFTSGNFYSQYNKLERILKDSHEMTKALYKKKDAAMYDAFSKYSVQLEKLAFIFYFETRASKRPTEAEITMANQPTSFLKQLFFPQAPVAMAVRPTVLARKPEPPSLESLGFANPFSWHDNLARVGIAPKGIPQGFNEESSEDYDDESETIALNL